MKKLLNEWKHFINEGNKYEEGLAARFAEKYPEQFEYLRDNGLVKAWVYDHQKQTAMNGWSPQERQVKASSEKAYLNTVEKHGDDSAPSLEGDFPTETFPKQKWDSSW